jgi:hypothetical protein
VVLMGEDLLHVQTLNTSDNESWTRQGNDFEQSHSKKLQNHQTHRFICLISNVSIDTCKKPVTPTIQDEHLACI